MIPDAARSKAWRERRKANLRQIIVWVPADKVDAVTAAITAIVEKQE